MTATAVLFDLDRTLLDRETALLAYARWLWRTAGGCRAATEAEFASRFVELDARGRTSKFVYLRQLKSEYRLRCGLREMLDRFETVFPSTVRPFPDALPLLRRLTKAGIRCGVVSNGHSKGQRDKLARSGLLPLVGAVAISEELGMAKPDPRIFHWALAELDCGSDSAWFVGDSEEADMVGAKAAGMRAVLLRRAGDDSPSVADVEIGKLADVWTVVAACDGAREPRALERAAGAR